MPSLRLSARIAVLGLTLPLAACAMFESKADRAMKTSPDYKAGYNDGCASASRQDSANMRQAGITRDQDAYAKNKAYHAGWGTGFNGCRAYRPMTDGPSRPDRGPIPDPY